MQFQVDTISRVLQLELMKAIKTMGTYTKKVFALSNVFVIQVIQTQFQHLEDLRIGLRREDEKSQS